MVLIGFVIGAVVIAGAITAWYAQSKAETEAKTSVIKATAEAKAIEKGTSGATSTDIGFGLFKQEQAFESGKEKSNTLAVSGVGAQVVAQGGVDTSTGAAETKTASKTTEGGLIGDISKGAGTGGLDLGGISKIMIYGIIMFMIFMIIKGK